MADVTWVQLSKYTLRSNCGKFQISKTIHSGENKYTLWKLPNDRIKSFLKVSDAKNRAENIINNKIIE